MIGYRTGGYYEFPIISEHSQNKMDLLRLGNKLARETTKSSSLVSSYWLIGLGGLFPPKLSAGYANMNSSTFLLSNMKGPPKQLNFCGHPILDLMFWVPLMFSGLSISVISYKDSFKIGVLADKGILKDRKCVQEFCSLISSTIADFSKLESNEKVRKSDLDKFEHQSG